jgi:hypothetical protein
MERKELATLLGREGMSSKLDEGNVSFSCRGSKGFFSQSGVYIYFPFFIPESWVCAMHIAVVYTGHLSPTWHNTTDSYMRCSTTRSCRGNACWDEIGTCNTGEKI